MTVLTFVVSVRQIYWKFGIVHFVCMNADPDQQDHYFSGAQRNSLQMCPLHLSSCHDWTCMCAGRQWCALSSPSPTSFSCTPDSPTCEHLPWYYLRSIQFVLFSSCIFTQVVKFKWTPILTCVSESQSPTMSLHLCRSVSFWTLAQLHCIPVCSRPMTYLIM
jgi:hypothetical protein